MFTMLLYSVTNPAALAWQYLGYITVHQASRQISLTHSTPFGTIRQLDLERKYCMSADLATLILNCFSTTWPCKHIIELNRSVSPMDPQSEGLSLETSAILFTLLATYYLSPFCFWLVYSQHHNFLVIKHCYNNMREQLLNKLCLEQCCGNRAV